MTLLSTIETEGMLKDLFPEQEEDTEMCSLKDLFEGPDGKELEDIVYGTKDVVLLKFPSRRLAERRDRAGKSGNKIKVRVF